MDLLLNTLKTSITDRSKAIILLWFSVTCFWCQSFGDVSPYVCSYTTQNLIRAKILILFSGGPVYLIPKIL